MVAIMVTLAQLKKMRLGDKIVVEGTFAVVRVFNAWRITTDLTFEYRRGDWTQIDEQAYGAYYTPERCLAAIEDLLS